MHRRFDLAGIVGQTGRHLAHRGHVDCRRPALDDRAAQ